MLVVTQVVHKEIKTVDNRQPTVTNLATFQTRTSVSGKIIIHMAGFLKIVLKTAISASLVGLVQINDL